MSFALRFRENPDGPVLFERAFATEAEYEEVSHFCIDRDSIDFPNFVIRIDTCWNFCADLQRPIPTDPLIFVVRTNTCKNFCKDFFLPGLMTVLKTQNLAEKILGLLFCLLVGLSTLPLRCITLIPRYLQNQAHRKETHPLYDYLSKNGADSRLLNHDFIYVETMKLINRPNQNYDVWFSRGILRFIQLPTNGHGVGIYNKSGWVDYAPNIPLNQLLFI